MDVPSVRRKLLASLALVSPALIWSAYVGVRRAAMTFLYRPVALPEKQVLRDIQYHSGSKDKKHRLDFFIPEGSDWPIMIFVHGGGLDSGDKSLRVGGDDVYANIGRFYASEGIGVAVINYRLQPRVTWREQVDDVARATAWVFANAQEFGGDPNRLFIAGHSAGAHLATRIALDPKPLARFDLSPCILNGVIAVSGAGFDLADEQTYRLGQKLRRYERCFRCGDPTDQWKKEASPITYAACGAPPFLLLYAEGESKSLQRQSQLLYEVLQEKEIPSELVVVPKQNHSRIVLTLSRSDKTSGPAILRFIRETPDRQPISPEQLDLAACG